MQLAPGHGRVILHIDMDSYYAQVEMKRLGIPRETPCAVQQWEGLIAVNYAARARGITRHMRVGEARQKCPEIVLVHVETIGADGEGSGQGGADDAASLQHKRLTQKASLERYRRATAEVVALLRRLAPQAVIEKASIDEVYMDVTAMVDRELQEQGEAAVAPASVDAFHWSSIVLGGPLDPGSEFDRRLSKGAEIACRLRGRLLQDLSFTSSAGIAHNKLLAKVGSALHKPNQQTVITPRGVQEVMRPLPLDKLRGFGGKLGGELEELGCATAGNVQDLSHATLVSKFGQERAAAIEQAVRGESQEPVKEKERPKSMLAAKSFNPTSDMDAIARWFTVLAEELAVRLGDEEALYRRRPRHLVIHYRPGSHPSAGGTSERSKSCPMPRAGPEGASAAALAAAALALFKARCMEEALPCNRLAISATDFVELPSSSSASAITRFLVPRPSAAADATPVGAAAADAAEGASAATAGAAVASGSAAGGGGSTPGRGSGAPSPLAPQRQLVVAAAGGKQVRPGAQQAQQAQQGACIAGLFDRARKKQRLQQEADEAQPAQRLVEPPAEQQGQAAPPPLPQQLSQQQQLLQQAAAPSGGLSLSRDKDATPAAASDSSSGEAPAAGAGASDVAAGAAIGEGAASAPAVADDDPLLAGVDLQEQQRILKEIELQRVLGLSGGGAPGQTQQRGGGPSGGRGRGQQAVGARKPATAKGKQRGISAFFQRRG